MLHLTPIIHFFPKIRKLPGKCSCLLGMREKHFYKSMRKYPGWLSYWFPLWEKYLSSGLLWTDCISSTLSQFCWRSVKVEENGSKGGGEGNWRPCFLNTIWVSSVLAACHLPSNGYGIERKEGKSCWGMDEGAPTLTHKSTHCWRTGTFILDWQICAEQNDSLVQLMEGQWLLWLGCTSWATAEPT